MSLTKSLFKATVVSVSTLEVISLLGLRRSVESHRVFWEQESQRVGAFRYLALGDSAAQAVGSFDPRKGYVYQLKQSLEAEVEGGVSCTNLSISGATARSVLEDQLNALDLKAFDLVTLGVGGNDVLKKSVDSFAVDFFDLLSRLPKGSFVSNIPYFGGRVRRPKKVMAMNDVVYRCVADTGMHLVDLYSVTKDCNSMLAYSADLLHPNAKGYGLWHYAFWKEIGPWLKVYLMESGARCARKV
jgi:acyl-CoA thioesterase-1